MKKSLFLMGLFALLFPVMGKCQKIIPQSISLNR